MVSTIVALAAGCSGIVAGHPIAAEPTTVNRRIPGDLNALLPDPTRFPAGYQAVVLPPEAAAQAAEDLTGVARGATVLPARCTPPQQGNGPDRTAIAVGTDNDTRATLTVELTRTDRPLGELRAQLRGCGEIRVSKSGLVTTVGTELFDAPPVDADDTLGLTRTVRPDAGGTGTVRTMLTLVGQISDVRITVTYMSFGDARPDAEALDELFAVAAREVREA
ncbi:DUF5642 family protein [Nocardia sp. NEAU-351]|uniref:DUF5642 family protein n=1 Tax=Nocardia bovistercoris TaxID=2785916 RepID=A0A931I767_9NOCA|nr:DUF5642 family protein [Nocardia bovistercoris]